MNINPGIDESIYNVEMNKDERSRLVIEDLKHLSFLKKS